MKRPKVKFKNKKLTLCRRKHSTNTNNWNNRTDICARGTLSKEAYEAKVKWDY